MRRTIVNLSWNRHDGRGPSPKSAKTYGSVCGAMLTLGIGLRFMVPNTSARRRT